jgi:predicted metal-dependent RNase
MNPSSSESNIKITPLFGGRGDVSAIAVVLQLGEVKILLDCGFPINKGLFLNGLISSSIYCLNHYYT